MNRVCVHGLGYIGLPTAAMFANHGHQVVGVDTNEEVLAALRDGEIHIDEPGLQAFLTEAIDTGNLSLSTTPVEAASHVVCVPTPLTDEGDADLAYVRAAGRAIASRLRQGDVVILESTVPPRTTVDVLGPVLEESGLAVGDDFGLYHCPETVLPGNVITELRENDRIVGGVGDLSAEPARSLYDSFVSGEIRVAPTASTAEFVKLLQNTFRDTNVALANEIAKLADDYGIDGRVAIDLANHHPRVGLHDPGPGVGGHCLPVDPWFLGQGSDRLDLIERAREINDRMPGYVAEILSRGLERPDGVAVAVLGAAYKGNVDDVRGSPGLALARTLRRAPERTASATVADGGQPSLRAESVTVHDPHVDDHPDVTTSLNAALSGADAAVVTTDHDEYADLDPGEVTTLLDGELVLDTKDVLDRETWTASDLELERI